MTTREDVLKALDSEAAYQLDRWGPDAHNRSFDEWVMYISQYAQEAQTLTTHGAEAEAKNHIRKVASMCFHFMMQEGAPQREGFER